MANGPSIRLSLIGAAQPDSHDFGVEGGIFGRSRKCDWLLPDGERILSSVHGRVLFENGAFVLVDESTNGIFVQDSLEPLGRGNAVRLADGMCFSAGPYSIEARAVQGTASPPALDHSHRVAAPLGHAPEAGQGYRKAQGAENALRQDDGLGALWGRNSQDPLDYLDGPPAGGDALLGNPAPISDGSASQNPQPSPVHMARPGGNGATSAEQASPAPSDVATRIPEDFLANVGALKQGEARQPQEGRSVSPSQPPPAARIPEDFDPLTALTGMGRHQPAETRQPDAIDRPSVPAPQAGPTGSEPLSPELMADLFEIHDPAKAPKAADAGGEPVSEELRALRSRRAGRRAALREKTAPEASPPVPPIATVPHDSAIAASTTAPGAVSHEAGSPGEPEPAEPAHGADAIKPLLEGMGFPEVEVEPGDRDRLLRAIGETVRESASGLIALLSARRAVKSEFRMDETQVRPEENNPYKFFNVAELVLDELFLTRNGGFQAPGKATREAFEDVQHHTLLTTSAMQRAIKIVLERLSPETIAHENGGEGALKIRGLSGRKDKWTAYSEGHAKMSANVDTIARQVIGEAFAQVHEEQAREAAKAHWGKAE